MVESSRLFRGMLWCGRPEKVLMWSRVGGMEYELKCIDRHGESSIQRAWMNDEGK
jgi:hypothetical protein